MLPYQKEKILSFFDVKDEYPKNFNMKDLDDSRVKKFIKEEYKELCQEELDQIEYDHVIGLRRKKPSPAQLKEKYLALAYARALYKFYWCHYNVWDQIAKYRYKLEDTNTIINKMEQTKKFNPWSTTEPTAGQYIASLGRNRFKHVITREGEGFDVLSPKDY